MVAKRTFIFLFFHLCVVQRTIRLVDCSPLLNNTSSELRDIVSDHEVEESVVRNLGENIVISEGGTITGTGEDTVASLEEGEAHNTTAQPETEASKSGPQVRTDEYTPGMRVYYDSNSTNEHPVVMGVTQFEPQEVFGCPGDHKVPCIAKCCDLHHGYVENRSCRTTTSLFRPNFTDCPNYLEDTEGLNIAEEDRYEYFIGDPCQDEKFMLMPEMYPEDEYVLYSNGSLSYNKQMYSMSGYCVENFENQLRAFVCFPNEPPKKAKFQYILYPIGLLISVPFLISTAVIYLCIEQLRDTQGKALACHVSCLAIGYFFLALVQLATEKLPSDLCIAAAFLIQFFFVAAFFWLNVLCYDTWRNIHYDTQPFMQASQAKRDKRRFVLYSLYAWYGPSVLLIVSLIMDLEPAISEDLMKPHFGSRSCWFSSDAAALPYFYGPVGFLILINVVLFLLSARKIFTERRNAAAVPLRHSISVEERNKDTMSRGKINLKALKRCMLLFAVMGINWVAEVISWAIGGPDYIWVVTDVFNTLQGLLIFHIFVIKQKRVRNLVSSAMNPVMDRLQSFRR